MDSSCKEKKILTVEFFFKCRPPKENMPVNIVIKFQVTSLPVANTFYYVTIVNLE